RKYVTYRPPAQVVGRKDERVDVRRALGFEERCPVLYRDILACKRAVQYPRDVRIDLRKEAVEGSLEVRDVGLVSVLSDHDWPSLRRVAKRGVDGPLVLREPQDEREAARFQGAAFFRRRGFGARRTVGASLRVRLPCFDFFLDQAIFVGHFVDAFAERA